MCSRAQCVNHVGKYVRFRTAYGYHEGVIKEVSGNKVVIMSPKKYIPVQLLSEDLSRDDEERLDLALAWGGYGGRAGAYGGGPGAYGGGYPGWGGYGFGGGWALWAIPFLSIFALFGLFFFW